MQQQLWHAHAVSTDSRRTWNTNPPSCRCRICLIHFYRAPLQRWLCMQRTIQWISLIARELLMRHLGLAYWPASAPVTSSIAGRLLVSVADPAQRAHTLAASRLWLCSTKHTRSHTAHLTACHIYSCCCCCCSQPSTDLCPGQVICMHTSSIAGRLLVAVGGRALKQPYDWTLYCCGAY